MFYSTISLALIFTVAQAQFPQGLQFPNFPGFPVASFPNPSTLVASTFPWMNNNNNAINTRLGPFGFGNGNGITPNSFASILPWNNGPISGPLSQALQAMQIPLQGFQAISNLFRPQLPSQSQLNNIPVSAGQLPVFQQENGPTLNNLNTKPAQQQAEDSSDFLIPDLSQFPLSEVHPGQVNTPGSDLIADFINKEKAETVKATDKK